MAAYEEAEATALAAYEEAEAAAWKAYEEADATALAAYHGGQSGRVEGVWEAGLKGKDWQQAMNNHALDDLLACVQALLQLRQVVLNYGRLAGGGPLRAGGPRPRSHLEDDEQTAGQRYASRVRRGAKVTPQPAEGYREEE